MVLARSTPFAEHSPFVYEDDSNVAFTDQGWQEHHFWLVVADGPGRAWRWIGSHTSGKRLLSHARFGASGVLPREKSLFLSNPANVSCWR
jgi:hypothetical protein